MQLPFTARLNCPHSYADDYTEDLMCEYGMKCTGEIYQECQLERCLYNTLCVCCYPIDDCENCPNNPHKEHTLTVADVMRKELRSERRKS